MAWVNNYIHVKQFNISIHPCFPSTYHPLSLTRTHRHIHVWYDLNITSVHQHYRGRGFTRTLIMLLSTYSKNPGKSQCIQCFKKNNVQQGICGQFWAKVYYHLNTCYHKYQMLSNSCSKVIVKGGHHNLSSVCTHFDTEDFAYFNFTLYNVLSINRND